MEFVAGLVSGPKPFTLVSMETVAPVMRSSFVPFVVPALGSWGLPLSPLSVAWAPPSLPRLKVILLPGVVSDTSVKVMFAAAAHRFRAATKTDFSLADQADAASK